MVIKNILFSILVIILVIIVMGLWDDGDNNMYHV